MDNKIPVGMLETMAIQTKIQLAGNLGIPIPDISARTTMLNNLMESLVVTRIDPDGPYFKKVAELKKYLRYDYMKIPQNNPIVTEKIHEWDVLLTREFDKQHMLGARSMAARI